MSPTHRRRFTTILPSEQVDNERGFAPPLPWGGGAGGMEEVMPPQGTTQGILRGGSLEMVTSTASFNDRERTKVICDANGLMGPHTQVRSLFIF